MNREDNSQPGKTLACCRDFYKQYGADLIHSYFPQYEGRIAVGLVGEGSECFGFDDEISRDHDFGPGFCMWLLPEDYAAIGESLQNAYLNLIIKEGARFYGDRLGYEGSTYNPRLDTRRGVMEISSFYSSILRVPSDLDGLLNKRTFLRAEERWLATAVNGEVFRDDAGVFTGIRNEIQKHYPRKLLLYRIAEQMHLFSHGGQSNYPRMMARGDYVTSGLCLNLAIQSAMNLSYLLQGVYAPYYKWQRMGLDRLPRMRALPQLLDLLALLPVQRDAWNGVSYDATRVNTGDQAAVIIEAMASVILEELKSQGIVQGEETFLESYVGQISQMAEKEP